MSISHQNFNNESNYINGGITTALLLIYTLLFSHFSLLIHITTDKSGTVWMI